MDHPESTADAVIVGAGSAGLTLAILLGRAGLRVQLHEKQPSHTAVPRGEILQPNGLAVLARMGLLDALRSRPHADTRYYRFCRIGGPELATFDYAELDHPQPTTLVLMPQTVYDTQAAALAELPNVTLHTDSRCTGLLKTAGRVTGAIFQQDGNTLQVAANLVVGADGAFSRVRRELGISATVSPYDEGYLTGCIPRPKGFDRDGYYYLGNNEILGLFPVSDDTLYFFYLLTPQQVERYRHRPLSWLRSRMAQIHPPVAGVLDGIEHWRDLHYFPCLKVMAHRWYAPGAALLGHAAHSVNPHVAQGRNLAMVDAEELAESVIPALQAKQPVRAATLHNYERARRPQAENLQRFGDELVTFWNAGNPILRLLRDQGFRGMSNIPSIRHRVTAQIAGLSLTPLGPYDRIRLMLGI